MGLGNILAANTVYRILNIAATFILTILLSRLMGSAGYGLFTLIIVNVTIYNLVSGFGAEAGITYHGAAGKFNTTKLVSFAFTIVLGQLLILFLIGIIYKSTYHQNWFGLQNLWPVIFIFLSISLTDKYNAMFYGHHLYSLVNKIIFFGNLTCMAVFAIIYFFSNNYSFQIYLYTYAVIALLQSVFLIVSFHLNTNQPIYPLKLSVIEWQLFFSYSLITVVTNFIQFLAYRIDYWILDYYKGEKELGVYSVSVKLVQLFWILPILFAGVLFPGTAAQRKEFGQERIVSILRFMNTINLISGLIAFFFITWFLPFFFGEEYADGIMPFRWLLPGIILFCNTTILAAYFAGKNQLKVNLVGSGLCLIIILTLDVLLIPSLGVSGAAIASSIGYGVSGFYYIRKYLKESSNNLSEMFILNRKDKDQVLYLLKKILVKK
ncbi:MAG: polysaccharide biosynthesis C-terminal domain-containing protein [Sphingobacteriales bacterium]